MKLFFEWLRRRARLIALLILSMAIAAAGGALYHMPAGAIIYPLILSAAIWIAAGIIDFLRTRARHYELRKIIDQQAALVSRLPDADTIPESDYADMVDGLRRTIADMRTQADARYNDAIDYFTVWAHQIKTPIASMRLNLQNEDTPLSRRLESDLFRIGQYADMVLAFLRMGSESTDYLFRECDLDGIIRASVKKFAGEFILRRLSLSYEGTNARAVTDENGWASFWNSYCPMRSNTRAPAGSPYPCRIRPSSFAIRASASRRRICRASSKKAIPAKMGAMIAPPAVWAYIYAKPSPNASAPTFPSNHSSTSALLAG